MGNQRREKYTYVSLKASNKIIKLVSRGYIMGWVILKIILFFYVPKVTQDICMFFDATVSILNDYLWDNNW